MQADYILGCTPSKAFKPYPLLFIFGNRGAQRPGGLCVGCTLNCLLFPRLFPKWGEAEKAELTQNGQLPYRQLAGSAGPRYRHSGI
jgi:hypothetical protein